MRRFRRPFHKAVARVFASMDPAFLLGAHCFFGGGTQVALLLDEFRESRNIDLLCSSRDGFRSLRETVSDHSLGRIMHKEIPLAREVRADRDGIRTFFALDEMRIKFEIVLEARIDLTGSMDRSVGLPSLDLDCIVAEKFMANADRGLDESTRSRDLIDLAFLSALRGDEAIEPGLRLAQSAYGKAVSRHLGLVLTKFEDEKRYGSHCAASLGIEDLSTLRKGLSRLRALYRRTSKR